MGAPEGAYLAAARAASAHVFVEDLEHPALEGGDRHHLGRVLRLRAGETVSAVDGRGRWRLCVFDGGAGLEAAGEIGSVAEPSPRITIGFALTKGDRPEWAVQKLTEIGVERIVPLVTARSVVRWEGERGAHHLARLREVARQAGMQSRRLTLPVVEAPATPAELYAEGAGGGGAADTGRGRRDRMPAPAQAVATPAPAQADGAPAPALPLAALAEPGGEVLSLAHPVVLVGPEGGWEANELEAAPARVTLGPNILRTETAAVVAATLLVALRSGLVDPSVRR